MHGACLNCTSKVTGHPVSSGVMLCLLLCCFLTGLPLLSKRWLVVGVLPRVFVSFFVFSPCLVCPSGRRAGGFQKPWLVVSRARLPCVCSKEELFDAVCRQRSNLEMQAYLPQVIQRKKMMSRRLSFAENSDFLRTLWPTWKRILHCSQWLSEGKHFVCMFWNVEKRLSTSQNTVVLDTLKKAFVEELVADLTVCPPPCKHNWFLTQCWPMASYSLLVFVSDGPGKFYKSDQRGLNAQMSWDRKCRICRRVLTSCVRRWRCYGTRCSWISLKS